MGMGYGANFSEVVSNEFVEKIVGKALYDSFLSLVDELEGYDVITLFAQEDYESVKKGEDNYEVCSLYKKLISTFEKKTGLGLYLNYHDSDSEGSRYDEVDGRFWCVSGVYTLSKAGKKYKNEIERKFWVTFG